MVHVGEVGKGVMNVGSVGVVGVRVQVKWQ